MFYIIVKKNRTVMFAPSFRFLMLFQYFVMKIVDNAATRYQRLFMSSRI